MNKTKLVSLGLVEFLKWQLFKKNQPYNKSAFIEEGTFLATGLVCVSSLLILVGAQFITWLQSHCTYQPFIQKASSCFQQISYNKPTVSDKASW